jgi:flap endonuclease-1
LCGCDYCDSIKGIGPKRAYELIQKYNCLESILDHIDKKKYTVPEEFDFVGARRLFFEHEVTTDVQFQWKKPDAAGMSEFLVNEKGFSQTRVDNVCKHLTNARGEKQQTRMDSFFMQARSVPASSGKKKDKAPAKKPPVGKGSKK